MKRTISLILAVILCFTMTGTALADNGYQPVYEDQAQALKTLGVFGGTDKGFELDRTATRMEASVMLVRLLGMESQALAIEGTMHPFKDVPQWADKYVSWLYTNKIAGGTSATTFSPKDSCTIQMYCTLLLRALGYSDTNGDFTYDDAIYAGYVAGLCDIVMENAPVYRDMLAHMSYNAVMTCNLKDGTALADKLIASGVFTKESFDIVKAKCDETTKQIIEFIDTSEMATAPKKQLIATGVTQTTTANGTLSLETTVITQFDAGAALCYSKKSTATLKLNNNEITTTELMQYQDGYFYSHNIVTDSEGTDELKIKAKAGQSTVDYLMNSTTDGKDVELSSDMIKYATKTVVGDTTYYIVNVSLTDISDAMAQTIEDISSISRDDLLDGSYMRYAIAAKDGKIVSIYTYINLVTEDMTVTNYLQIDVDTSGNFTIAPITDTDKYTEVTE